eukprot:6189247-Pleurochrysis_carterae.AAC.3
MFGLSDWRGAARRDTHRTAVAIRRGVIGGGEAAGGRLSVAGPLARLLVRRELVVKPLQGYSLVLGEYKRHAVRVFGRLRARWLCRLGRHVSRKRIAVRVVRIVVGPIEAAATGRRVKESFDRRVVGVDVVARMERVVRVRGFAHAPGA